MQKLTRESLAALKSMHPKGWIPMSIFNMYEPIFREYMRAHNLRAFYRGPRKSNNVNPWTTPSMTRRCDATHVVFGAK